MAVKNITDLHVLGDVGIGTTSPSYKLDVSGEGRFTSYLNVDATVGIRSSGWVHLHRYGSSTNVAVGQSGTNVNLLVNNGNIETQQNIKSKGYLLFDNDGDFSGGNYYTMEDHSGGYFRMGYAFNSDLVISTSGNIGIGTTNPGRKLHVVSNGAIAEFKSTDTGTGGFAEVHYENDAGDQLVVGSVGSGYTNTAWTGARYMYATAGDLMIKTIGSGTNLRFYTAGATNERMRIDGSGNVGIGTTSPAEKLHVTGRVHIGDVNYSYGGSNYHIKLAEDTNDAYISNINGYGILSAGGYYHGGNLRMLNSTSTAYSAIQMRPDGTMHFESATGGTAGTTIGASTKMYISGAGNVGIGTTSPAAKLEVVGDTYLRTQLFTDTIRPYSTDQLTLLNGGNNFLYVNGNVGIGTTSPSYKLHVVGETYLDGRRNFGDSGATWYWAASGGKVNIDCRNFSISGDTGARLHKWNRNTADTAYLPYYENWYDGNSYHSIGVENNIWQLSDGLTVGGDINIPNQASYKIEDISILTSSVFTGDTFLGIANELKVNAITGEFTFNSANVLFGNLSYGSIPAQALFGVTNSGITTDFGGSNIVNIFNGNVGIGTTSPNAKLKVVATASNTKGVIEAKSTYATSSFFSAFRSAPSDGSTTANGGLWMGAISNDNATISSGAIYRSAGQWRPAGTTASVISLASGQINFHTNSGLTADTDFIPSNRMSILPSGNVGIGTTSPSEKLEVDGNILASGDITAFSDARIKENVETLPNALESIKAMRGVTYNKIGEEKQSIGVIAQEVQAVLPQLVSEHSDGMLSVAYGNITGVLIEAIKEQQKQIDELKAQLNASSK